ncbi:DUF4097 family beta strand repeat-containing protein [Streptomyces huiliensis]|uniref:DUF4097 family beta strand repeat-containing protein n=1 Tax=Streptomyces huiliensis TaxID=2876027 RepID=UPI001CBFDA9C|nr:hypothetical protein [Streptomyces huiliensis]MBZ4321487.1 hypothetical protein [Streptomyces huiliensis]
MPLFATPEPVSATVEFDIGVLRVIAGDRADTVVDVLPTDPAEEADVRAAEQTRIACSDGALLVKGPRQRSLFGRTGSVEVRIGLPAGSEVRATTLVGDLFCEGSLGDCRLKTSVGHVQAGETATARLRTGHGGIRLDRARGDAELVGAGPIDAGAIGGAATVKNLNGETALGEVGGDLRVSSSNGAISVGVAHGDVDARSANGGIHLGQVIRGRVTLQSSAGDLEVGIGTSTAAWLELTTRLGSVRNALGLSDGPGDAETTVEVRARTGIGDIEIRRP